MTQKKKLRPQIKVAFFVIICLVLFFIVKGIVGCSKTDDSEKPVESEKVEDTNNGGNTLDGESKTEEIPKPEEKEKRLSFVCFGDNLIHSSVFDDAERVAKERGLGERYYFDNMYADFYDVVNNADISYINQESPICGDSLPIAGYPNFNTPTEMGDMLSRFGFDVINCANNHMLDCRGKGLSSFISYLKSKSEFTEIGGYENKADYENIRVVERDGVKVAFLAYTYSTNGMTPGEGYEDLYIPYIDNDEMARMVKKAKEVADFVFVSMHWGDEDNFDVTASQKDSAQALVDAGVDVIVGMHPHVVQEMKWKDRPDGGKTLIIYSLGNFMSTMYYPWNMLGGYVSLDIVKNGDKCTIENPIFNPTVTHYNMSRRGLHLYRFEDYSEDLYKTHGTTLKASGWSYERWKETVKKYIPEEFLPEYLR